MRSGTARSKADAVCATGIGRCCSSGTGGKIDDDIGEGSGNGKDSRCMLSAGRGTVALRGEVEGALEGDWVVMLTEGGELGGVKSSPLS